ncbi:uncharacterized protein LOC142356196, partial [Convolutriloba macropyga]|uniref:uncharacterized protein LOC142356196 n=1 Tax=Convolutriloba macropyga TaxID=536237 RepID=UPI003F5279AA
LDTTNRVTKMHLSDLMRYALLFKYGGFYFDRDVLTLRSLTNYTNVVSIENSLRKSSDSCDRNVVEYSYLLNGGAMHFEAGSAFIAEAMRVCNETYKQGMNWLPMGPPALHIAALRFLGMDPRLKSHTVSTPQLSVLPSSDFKIILPGRMEPIFGMDVDESYFYNYTRC